MKFALATPGRNNYPAAMAPWEPKASGGAEMVRFARKADELSWDWLTLPEHLIMPTDMAPVWAHATLKALRRRCCAVRRSASAC